MSETDQIRRRKAKRAPIEVQLELQDWGPRGSVVANFDGHTVLVDRGLPGERVLALVDKRRKPRQGIVHEVQQPAAERSKPICSHYLQSCGGCQMQHLDYAGQLRLKEQVVNREFANAGLTKEVDRVHPMVDPWRYRGTAAIALGWEAGFRPKGRRGIVAIHDCPISHPLIGRFCDRLNTLLRGGRLPNFHGRVWLDSAVIGSEQQPFLQVLIQGIEGLTLESHPELPEMATVLSRVEGVRSVAFRHRSGEPRALIGPLTNPVEVDGRRFHLPVGSFFQANTRMLSLVIERMRTALAQRNVPRAADVYGGVGVLGLSLLDKIDTLTLIELDSLAVEAARTTAQEMGASEVHFIGGHAEDVLDSLTPQDLIVVDPPRSGLGQTVTNAISTNSPSLIFYLSCSPSSLALDSARLRKAGYQISCLEVFDFYPQTYHVESVAIFERWS